MNKLFLTQEEWAIWNALVEDCRRKYPLTINVGSEKRRNIIIKIAQLNEVRHDQAKTSYEVAIKEVINLLEEWEEHEPPMDSGAIIAAGRGHLWPYVDLLRKHFGQTKGGE